MAWRCHDVDIGVVTTIRVTVDLELLSLPVYAVQSTLFLSLLETVEGTFLSVKETLVIFLCAGVYLHDAPLSKLILDELVVGCFPLDKTWVVFGARQDIFEHECYHEVRIAQV